MKRVFLLMTTILLLMMPLGCTQTPQEEAPPEQEIEQTQPLHLTSLSIELQRDGQDAQQLLEAIKVLPEQLQTALASYDVFKPWNPAVSIWPFCPLRHWPSSPPPLTPLRCPDHCFGTRGKTWPPGTRLRRKHP